MENKPAIIVTNVTKIYPKKPQLMKLREDTFVKYLSKTFSRQRDPEKEYFALDQISFTVNPGESIGLIGANGAGKSTLLRVMAGITEPTAGSIKINGRHGELFALNSGFNRELSGRKNIYLIGSIKGFSNQKIEGLLDKIINFSELGDFIDQPVKVYSSGMRGRLGFSILIHLLPEIIFIDEALSTGDLKFQEKCIGRLEEFIQDGKTLIIVSHARRLIKSLCTRAIWLDKGKILMDGEIKEVLNAYEE